MRYERPRSWRHGAFVLGLAAAGCLPAGAPPLERTAPATPVTENPATAMEFSHLTDPAGEFVPVRLKLAPFQPGAGPPAVAAEAAPSAFTHIAGAADGASRAPASAAADRWRIVWKAFLEPSLEPFGLLATPTATVVVGRLHQLFDAGGKSLHHGLTGAALPVLDDEAEALLVVDAGGGLVRRSLRTGAVEFEHLLPGGDDFAYTFVRGRAGEYVTGGTERQLDPHGRHRASTSRLDRISVRPPFVVDPETHLLMEAEGGEQLVMPGVTLVVAARGETMVAAAQDVFFTVGERLSVSEGIGGNFAPLAMSLDARGVAHLLVRSTRGLRYWAVDRDGRRFRDLVVAGELPRLVRPPIPCVDGRVLVPLRKGLLVLDAEGESVATLPVHQEAPLAVAQPDGSVLIADRGEIRRVDRDLKGTVLVRLEGEQFRTPAVPVTAGRIVVATDSVLYCLEPGEDR